MMKSGVYIFSLRPVEYFLFVTGPTQKPLNYTCLERISRKDSISSGGQDEKLYRVHFFRVFVCRFFGHGRSRWMLYDDRLL